MEYQTSELPAVGLRSQHDTQLIEQCQKLMARGFAHEVKNPLQMLQLAMDYLNDLPEMHEHYELLKDMNHSLERVDSVAQSMLDLMSDSGLISEPCDVRALVEETVSEFSLQLEQCHNQVHIKIPPDTRVMTDRRQLHWLLRELLANAITASPHHADIEFCAEERDDNLVLSLKNSDVRLSAEQFEQLYDPFYTTAPAGEGAGLGLCRVKKIMRLHQGDVTLFNNEQGGVSCELRFPLKAQRPD